MTGNDGDSDSPAPAPVTREEILSMMKRRDAIDQTIQNLGQILKSNNIGMSEPLVDPEGYPRNDIDVFQVRHARHQIICLQNDFKNLTKEIEKKMELFHEQNRSTDTGPSTSNQMDIDLQANSEPSEPIVKVNEVTEGSPADSAGLQVDDRIISFGSIDSSNFTSLKDIGDLVSRSVGKTINLQVKRGHSIIKSLSLIPGTWSGRGLLGCNIVNIESESTTTLDR